MGKVVNLRDKLEFVGEFECVKIIVGTGGLIFDSVGDKRLPPASIALDCPKNEYQIIN